jgi:hypothetical protein
MAAGITPLQEIPTAKKEYGSPLTIQQFRDLCRIAKDDLSMQEMLDKLAVYYFLKADPLPEPLYAAGQGGGGGAGMSGAFGGSGGSAGQVLMSNGLTGGWQSANIITAGGGEPLLNFIPDAPKRNICSTLYNIVKSTIKK